jgi:dTDP-4-amino-4,6-dideoxygalactose transaminase
MNPPQILLSTPHMGDKEFAYVKEAFDTNWIAPIGPHIDTFEQEFCQLVGSPRRRP